MAHGGIGVSAKLKSTLYDREMLLSILTNRIGYTLAGSPNHDLVVVSDDVIEVAQSIAESLLNVELADRHVLKSLVGLMPKTELEAEIRESLEEILANLVKS